MPSADLLQSGLFRDQVFSATELVRRHKEVLDQAAKSGAVTISRKNEQFALMMRDQAASLVRTVNEIAGSTEVLWGAFTLAVGDEVPRNLQWLKAFDEEDLQILALEITTAVRGAVKGESDWDAVSALIHEWHESATVIQSGVLKQALSEPEEKVAVSAPETAGTVDGACGDE